MNPLVRSKEWNRLSRDPFASFGYDLRNFSPSDLFRSSVSSTDRVPAVDIEETDTDYRVVADLPGISKENLDVSVNSDILSIVVSSQEESEQNFEGRVLLKERYQGKITRSFRLSDTLDSENIQATYKDGVLSISVPKKEPTQPRKIEVSVH